MNKFFSISAIIVLIMMLALVGCCSNPANSDPADNASFIVFDDAIQNAFYTLVLSEHDDATVVANSQDFSNPAGGKSVAVTIVTADWGGVYLDRDNGVNVSDYNTLKFSVKTDAITDIAFLELVLEDANEVTKAMNLLDAANISGLTAEVDVKNTGWTNYAITLADIKEIDWTQFLAIGFFDPEDTSRVALTGTFFIDNVRFMK